MCPMSDTKASIGDLALTVGIGGSVEEFKQIRQAGVFRQVFQLRGIGEVAARRLRVFRHRRRKHGKQHHGRKEQTQGFHHSRSLFSIISAVFPFRKANG